MVISFDFFRFSQFHFLNNKTEQHVALFTDVYWTGPVTMRIIKNSAECRSLTDAGSQVTEVFEKDKQKDRNTFRTLPFIKFP